MPATIVEYRDAAESRRYLLQGIWLRKLGPATPEAAAFPLDSAATLAREWTSPPVTPEELVTTLNLALSISGAGDPVPPLGLIADVAALALGGNAADEVFLPLAGPGWDAGLGCAYEDLVLGRLCIDSGFERAGAALCRYNAADRIRGCAFLLNRLRERTGCGGVLLSPALIKSLLQSPAAELLVEGRQSLVESGPLPVLVDLYREVIAGVRDAAVLLGPEDLFELEHRTPLLDYGSRMALRQVLQAVEWFDAALPQGIPRHRAESGEASSSLCAEASYPVGGFSSISTRGSIESLLHSQLAYMEIAGRPDLFDIKFLRDELLYYSRDESEFFRRRRTVIFALHSELAQIRVKDPGLPWQRMVLLLAMLVIATRKLLGWLNREALKFEVLFVDAGPGELLAEERRLLELVWKDQLEMGIVEIRTIKAEELEMCCAQAARRSLCRCLLVGTDLHAFVGTDTAIARLALNNPRPEFTVCDEPPANAAAETLDEAWHQVAGKFLRFAL